MTKEEREIEIQCIELDLQKEWVEMLALKLEFAGGMLRWLDDLEQKFPEATDSLKELTEILLDRIEGIEQDMQDHFESLLEVSKLYA